MAWAEGNAWNSPTYLFIWTIRIFPPRNFHMTATQIRTAIASRERSKMVTKQNLNWQNKLSIFIRKTIFSSCHQHLFNFDNILCTETNHFNIGDHKMAEIERAMESHSFVQSFLSIQQNFPMVNLC